MRRYLAAISIGIVLVAWITSCAGIPGEISGRLDEEISLSIGQSASIEEEKLQIKFLEVVSDSRCPRDVTCVWEGEASSLVEITFFESLHRVVLTEPGLTSQPSRKAFKEYQIAFHLDPYPEAGKKISKDDYRLRLVVSKLPTLSGGILVTFDVIGETYKVFITHEDTIEEVLAVQQGESQATIPSGRLLKGKVFYNEPWSWHIDPEDIHMVESTIELCDGTPSQVEAELDYWVDKVQRFCPWSASIVEIRDYR